MTGSPLARRLRLASVLRDLRDERDLTHTDLARLCGVSSSTISRLENPGDNVNRKPSLHAVHKLLTALGVARRSDLWHELDGLAEAGADGGWWDEARYARMGVRQRTFAIVEAGAAVIQDYALSLLPGPVQTEEYARYRALVGDSGGDVDVAAIVAGRMRRKAEVLDRGVEYRLVLEEQPVRRRAAPAEVMVAQLEHLLDLAARPNVSIRVLPVEAEVANGSGAAARAPFAHVSYPDLGDPRIVTVDTVTKDLLITDVDEVGRYAQLHERLCGAALSDADSAALIREAAGKLAATI